jgi:hypothetical protein
MIGHMHNQCFHCEKEFDFPHKRAALMILGRERFLIGASWRKAKIAAFGSSYMRYSSCRNC